MTSKSIVTRTSSFIFSLEQSITEDDKAITGCKLPTNGQILVCLKAFVQFDKLTMKEAAKKTLQLIKPHYLKADIPMSRDDSYTIRIIRFHEKHYRMICKISKKNR